LYFLPSIKSQPLNPDICKFMLDESIFLQNVTKAVFDQNVFTVSIFPPKSLSILAHSNSQSEPSPPFFMTGFSLVFEHIAIAPVDTKLSLSLNTVILSLWSSKYYKSALFIISYDFGH
jgi:hypothetical protein